MYHVELHCCSECRYCGGHGAVEVSYADTGKTAYDIPELVREKISRITDELAQAGKLRWCESEVAEESSFLFLLFDEGGERIENV